MRQNGECWVWCNDCNSKLYSTDGNKDIIVSCPNKIKCKEDENKYK